MTYVVGVDIGGTFTDVSVIDRDSGQEVVAKTPTTPSDLIDGLLAGLRDAAEQLDLSLGELLGATDRFSHATTQTTNVMFTRQGGADVGLFTTRGFGDEILIMRARGRVAGLSLTERRHLRATDKPAQIVPRHRIVELSERVDRSGTVLEPLRVEEVDAAVEHLVGQGVDSFAVSLLWSHQNPDHERLVRDRIRALAPQAHVSVSSDLAPVTGEYERASTTCVNAYVAPTLERYVDRLEKRLVAEGLTVPIQIFQAGGGVSDVPSVVPVATIESGPAAGMVAVQKLSALVDRPDIIATDVGGTTFKVGLVVDGRWSVAPETVIGQYALLTPMIEIVSIGAGGGSIAWVDNGRLRIGPHSAGAAPGPACYGWGGSHPTVTDADVILGYLSEDRPLSGNVYLDVEKAFAAMKEHVADQLFGGDVIAAAAGVREVVDSQMGDLIRKATLERGFDPRGFALASYGGAGPVHAASYARSAGLRDILVPLGATAFSAYGAAISDTTHSLQRSISPELSGDSAALNAAYDSLVEGAVARLAAQGVAEREIQVNRWADMRYERQLHDVRVFLPSGLDPDQPLHAALEDAFEARYALLFGRTARLDHTTSRVLRIGIDAVAGSGLESVSLDPRPGAGQTEVIGSRRVFWTEDGCWVETRSIAGESLSVGDTIHGPAVVDQPGTTVAVPPRAVATVDQARNLVITLPEDGDNK